GPKTAGPRTPTATTTPRPRPPPIRAWKVCFAAMDARLSELLGAFLVLRTMMRLLLVAGLLLTACGTVPQSHGGPVQDQVSLIDALRKTVTVDISGTVAQPFLHPASGTTVRLSGATLANPADLQLFEYSSAGTDQADAHQLRADGS